MLKGLELAPFFIALKNTKKIGDTAEIKFMLLSMELGHIVSKPITENTRYDLIIDTGEELQRIQIKSTNRKVINRNVYFYKCSFCYGSSHKEHYKANDIDYIAVYIFPEDAWYKIPFKAIEGKTGKFYPNRKPESSKYEQFRL